MAFVVSKPNHAWEIRESRSTPKGPRSKTLATFKTLTPDILKKARERSRTPFDEMALLNTARQIGAPVAASAADRAAAELLRELENGRRPRRVLERVLLGALGASSAEPSDTARAATAWIGVEPKQRGEALHDLLLLVDSLPARKQRARERFPRIESSPL